MLREACYSRVDPKDSFGWGIDVGFFISPNSEVGFLYGQQLSTLQASGTNVVDIGDMTVSTYHGTFTYNFGESSAAVRPYVMIGLGATSFGSVDYIGNRGPGTIRELDKVLQHLGRRREVLRFVEGRRACRRLL